MKRSSALAVTCLGTWMSLNADAATPLAYHGGPVLTSFTIFPVYYGSFPPGAIARYQSYLNTTARYISGVFDPPGQRQMLLQYGVHDATLNAVASPVTMPATTTPHPLSGSEATAIIHDAQSRNLLPAYRSGRLLILFTGTGFSQKAGICGHSLQPCTGNSQCTAQPGGSCNSSAGLCDYPGTCGYHSSESTTAYYSVIPDDGTGNPPAVIAHEVFEAAASPAAGTQQGWDETVDTCNTTFRVIDTLVSTVTPVELPVARDNRTKGGDCSVTGFTFSPLGGVGTPAGYVRSDGINSIIYTHPTTNSVRALELRSTGWRLTDLNSAASSSVTSTSQVSAYVRGDSTTAAANSVVFRGSDGRVRELAFSSVTGSWNANDLSGTATQVALNSSPSAYGRNDGINAVIYRGFDNHIHELSQRGFLWTNSDLSAMTGAPLAAGDPIGYVRADRLNSVVYKSTTGHIIELALTSQWQWANLSSITGATDSGRLVSFGPRPYVRPDGLSTIVYVDASKRIQEMSLGGNGWGIASLSNVTGTTTNIAVGYVRDDNVAAIVYINSDGHVREAALTPSGWGVTDLSAVSGAPAAFIRTVDTGSILNGYVRSGTLTTVVYESTSRHLIELARVGGSWSAADLSNLVGGP